MTKPEVESDLRCSRFSQKVDGVMILLVGIVILTVLVRLLFLAKESLDGDERVSAYIAGLNWAGVPHVLWDGEANMGFYFLLLHLWVGLGRTEFALRAFSVFVAAVTVPVFYVFGTRLFGRRAGVLSALLLALNVYHLRYSQQARSYALVVLLVTLSSMCFASAIRRSSWKVWTAYTATTILAIYSHFFAGFVLVAHWLSLAFLRRRDVPWRSFVTSTGVIGVLVLPLVPFILWRAPSYTWILRPDVSLLPRVLVYLAGVAPPEAMTGVLVGHHTEPLFKLTEAGRHLLMFLYAGICASALLGALRASRERSNEAWNYAFLVAWLAAPPILAYGLSVLVKPIFLPFYLIVSLPPFVFLAAVGLARIQRRAVFVGVLVLLVGLSTLQTIAYYTYGTKEDWRGITAFILARADRGDDVIFFHGSHPGLFDYYRRQLRVASSASPSLLSIDGWWDLAHLGIVVRPYDPQHDRTSRLWLVLSLATSSDSDRRRVEATVGAGRRLLEQQEFSGPVRVLLYGRPALP